MRVDATVAQDFGRLAAAVLRGFRNGLTFEDNIQASVVTVADTGLANTEFTVTHNLGKVPKYYFYTIDRAGSVYDSNKATWTITTIKLKCSVANALLNLIVL